MITFGTEDPLVDKSDIPYYTFNRSEHYFPTFEYTYETIPVGDPNPYCFWLSWTRKEESIFIDQFKPFAE